MNFQFEQTWKMLRNWNKGTVRFSPDVTTSVQLNLFCWTEGMYALSKTHQEFQHKNTVPGTGYLSAANYFALCKQIRGTRKKSAHKRKCKKKNREQAKKNTHNIWYVFTCYKQVMCPKYAPHSNTILLYFDVLPIAKV